MLFTLAIVAMFVTNIYILYLSSEKQKQILEEIRGLEESFGRSEEAMKNLGYELNNLSQRIREFRREILSLSRRVDELSYRVGNISNAICPQVSTNTTQGKSGTNHVLKKVRTWAYQLQNADPIEVANAGFDLIVMDYSRDGTDEAAYTYVEIEMIKEAGTIPIAYISIGEAEDYRFYWREEWYENPPEWLGRENPNWPGNYKVKYWYPGWKKIIFQYIDRIIDRGFEGIYLDVVDAFEYWSNPSNGEGFYMDEGEAARRMINFILEIAHYCREIKGRKNFYIIPQNGERIFIYDNGSLLEAISAIGIESLWYEGINPVPESQVGERLEYIEEISSTGIPVLLVEYVDDGTGYRGENEARINSVLVKALLRGFTPYIALSDMELDELNIIPGIQPPET